MSSSCRRTSRQTDLWSTPTTRVSHTWGSILSPGLPSSGKYIEPPHCLSPLTSHLSHHSNEGVYNLLLDRGADPDAQDTYGNTVLHMVVVASQLGMYGYALRHPRKNANPYIKNQRGLTCLTLSCELGRDTIFREMLELSCTEFWRYSNITCCGYPLGALDSIQPDGQTSQW